MWDYERKRLKVINIAVCAALVLVGIYLFFGLVSAKKQLAAENALLAEERNNQLQAMSNTKQENLEALQQIYEKDMQTVAKYLPGIVCWGDSLTAGSSGNISYPRTLQKYIDTYLCDIYDLRYSVENADGMSRVNWEDYSVSIPVVNMGGGHESSTAIQSRSGVVPYTIGKEFTIPADAETVEIEIAPINGKKVTDLSAGSIGINPVTINGVEGVLSKIASDPWSYKTPYRFTRLEAGEEVTVPVGTEIATACADQYQDYLHIIWVGTYGDFTTATNLVNDIRNFLTRQNVNPERYLVIGPCTIKGAWLDVAGTMDTIDSAMVQAFGEHYINLRKYLVEDGLRDAGLNSNDKALKGTVPMAFRSNAGGADMNAVAYQLVGKLVYEKMDALGYFDEIREELKLDAAAEALLKQDPAYFETQLK